MLNGFVAAKVASKTTRMEGICDAFLARYALVSPVMTQVSIAIGPCSSWRGLPAPSLNREFMCWCSRRRRRRRTHPMFFSDVSYVSYSTYSLNSSSALVARAAISKVRSRPASSLDSPARAEPERHRRCPPSSCFSMRNETIQHGPQNSTTGYVKNNLVADFRTGPFFLH